MKIKTKDDLIYGIVSGQNCVPKNLEASEVLKDYLDILRYQSKQRNNLLGQFSADGKYKVEDEKILQELKVVTKKFDEKVDNVVYAHSKIGNFVLNFKITFDISVSYCNANLALIEVENEPQEAIKHITLLDTLIEPYSPKFKENAYKLWNISFDADENVKNDYLFSYLHIQEEEFLFNKELTEILSQLFLVRMLKLLDGAGLLGEKIKQEYKLLVEKMLAQDPNIYQNHTKLKMLLNSVLIKNNAFKTLLKDKDAVLILANYSMPIMRVKEKSVPTVIREGTKKPKAETDKKKEEKKKTETPKAKKKAKSKSGKSIKPFTYDIGKAFGATYKTFSSKIASAVPKENANASTVIVAPKEQTMPEPKPQISKPEEKNPVGENDEYSKLAAMMGEFNKIEMKNRQQQINSPLENNDEKIAENEDKNASSIKDTSKGDERVKNNKQKDEEKVK